VDVVEVLLLLDDVDVTFTDLEVAFTEVEVGSFAVFQCPKSVNFSTVGRL
jgi:hypothetical protein